MIYELRTYTFHNGKLPAYIQHVEKVGRPVRGDDYGKCHGYWTAEFGQLNQAWHLWSYASLDERTRLREALSKNERWTKEYVPVVQPMLQRQDIRFLNPVVDIKPPAASGGVYELRIYRTQPGKAAQWAQLFKSVFPVREKYSPNVCLWTGEAPQPNEAVHMWNYPDVNTRMKVRAECADADAVFADALTPRQRRLSRRKLQRPIEQHVVRRTQLQQQIHVPDIAAEQQHVALDRGDVKQRIQQQLPPTPDLAAQLIRVELPPRHRETLRSRQHPRQDRRFGPGGGTGANRPASPHQVHMCLDRRDRLACARIGRIENADADGQFGTGHAAMKNRILSRIDQCANGLWQPSGVTVQIHHGIEQQRQCRSSPGIQWKRSVRAVPQRDDVICRDVAPGNSA